MRLVLSRLVNETDVVLYCDFHGHNRKNNVFMYGCNSRGDNALKLQERVFPLMMSKNASNKVEILQLFIVRLLLILWKLLSTTPSILVLL